ncbi:glycoside hydrolase superfamily [Geranomyces variabilis]|nr:glycoside hydrolase superfamily [Geranomyces variabilis]KAJ3131144.1 hypothetical protein HDU90_008693 [Geranomyces variabilis]
MSWGHALLLSFLVLALAAGGHTKSNTALLARASVASSANVHYITRNGHTLMDGPNPLRFVSFNVPTLYNTGDVNGRPRSAPTAFEQYDLLRSVKINGGKVARSYTFTVCCVGNDTDPNNFHMSGIGQYSEAVWRSTDAAIALAGVEGVRLIIPFIDWWSYHGGVDEFAAFRGKQRWDFFTDQQLRQDFKTHISWVLERVNTVTGLKYKDDPTIMLWELGNELGDWNGMLPPDWILDIAQHVKTGAPKQLVGDGLINQLTMLGELNPETKAAWAYNHTWKWDLMVKSGIMASPNIDVFSDHYYNAQGANDWTTRAAAGVQYAINQFNKAFYVGEFGFEGPLTLGNMIDFVVDSGNVSGVALWSLRGHSRFGGFYKHYERNSWFSYHIPGFAASDEADGLCSNSDETTTMALMRKAAAKINGLEKPVAYPIPDQPYLFAPTGGPKPSFRWLGCAGVATYEVWRQSGSAPWMKLADGVSDGKAAGSALFVDDLSNAVCGTKYRYIVRGSGETGPGPFSAAVSYRACAT